MHHLLARYLLHEVHALVGGFGDIVGLVVEDEFAHHHAVLAQHLGQFARIHSRDGRNLFALQPLAEALLCMPMAVSLAIVAHDECGDVDALALEELPHTILARREGRHAVVAHEGVGHHQHLASIRGVGQTFGVAHHGCVKHYFSSHGAFVAEGFSMEFCSITEEQCYLSHSILILV